MVSVPFRPGSPGPDSSLRRGILRLYGVCVSLPDDYWVSSIVPDVTVLPSKDLLGVKVWGAVCRSKSRGRGTEVGE